MLSETTLRALGKHTEFYERAAAFDGRPRERMIALGEADELFFRLYPLHYRALQLTRVASQLGKHARRGRDAFRRCESRTVALLTDVIRDALAGGDLELDGPQRPGELAFSVWALVFGTRALMNTAVACGQLQIENGYQTVRDTASLLFDALGWRPLSNEWDYAETLGRIRTEIFVREWQEACAA